MIEYRIILAFCRLPRKEGAKKKEGEKRAQKKRALQTKKRKKRALSKRKKKRGRKEGEGVNFSKNQLNLIFCSKMPFKMVF